MGTGKTTEEGKVDKDQRSRQSPVHVAKPEDSAEEVILGVGDMLMVVLDGGPGHIRTGASCQSEVGNEGDGRNEGGENMEDTLGLERRRRCGVSAGFYFLTCGDAEEI